MAEIPGAQKSANNHTVAGSNSLVASRVTIGGPTPQTTNRNEQNDGSSVGVIS